MMWDLRGAANSGPPPSTPRLHRSTRNPSPMPMPIPQPDYAHAYPSPGPGLAPGVPFPSTSPYPPSPALGSAPPAPYYPAQSQPLQPPYRPRSTSQSQSHHHHHHHSHSSSQEPQARTRSGSNSHGHHHHHHSHSHSHGHSHGHGHHRHHSQPVQPVVVAYPAGAQVTYTPGAAPVKVQYVTAPPAQQPYAQYQQSPQYQQQQYQPYASPPQQQYQQQQYPGQQYAQQQYAQQQYAQQFGQQQQQVPPPPARPHKDSMQHPDFQYSRCTGRKKALCIGINYVGQRNELRGCVNDASSVYHFLVDYQHYKKEDIVYLSDEAQDARSHPTRANMLNAMRWLVQDAHPHDSLFFHYSGHGGQTKDLDGDEVDGLDEVVFPVDYEQAGTIIDDVLHETMVKPLPPGCRLTAIFDSCHSGSVLDLPYLYHSNGRVKQGQVTRRFKERKSTPADVISWSGCMDSQTSADTVENGLAVGAMSYAFIKVLKRNPEISYTKLLQGLREILNKRYSQKPQLSSSHRIDTSLRFIM